MSFVTRKTDIGLRADSGSLALNASLYAISRKGGKEAWETEHHFHGWESWFEEAGTPTATYKACRVGEADGSGRFRMDAGNDTWGTWLQILGSADTPTRGSAVKYDLHRLMLTAVERNAQTHFVQIGFGATGAAALAAGTYTEFVFEPATAQAEEFPLDVMCKRIDSGELAWARCMVPGQNTGTVDFYFGIHEYTDPDV